MSDDDGAGPDGDNSELDEARIVHRDERLTIVRYRCVVIGYFMRSPTVEGLDAMGRHQREIIAKHGRVASISLIDVPDRNMAPEARAKASELSREFDAHTFSLTFVVLGAGARAVLTRSMISAIQFVSRPKAPWRVFAEADVEAAVAWVVESTAAAARPVDPAALSLAFVTAMGETAAEGADDVAVTAVTDPPVARDALPRTFGKYRLEKRLGSGGMAEVFLATHKGTGGFEKKLVVKTMLPHLAHDREFVEMFLREARHAARLNHTNLVQVFDAGEHEGTHYIAMEHVDGLSLLSLARRAWVQGIDIPIALVAAAGADAARGLHHAHTAVDDDGKSVALVHRDISPDNILVNREGVAKVVDFGVAKGTDRTSNTASGVIKGKIPFMAPEQLDNRAVDGRADLYALGASLYWLLTRERPFRANDEAALAVRILEQVPPKVSEKRAAVPAALVDLVAALLAKDPAQRPADGLAVARVLDAFVDAHARNTVADFVKARAAEPEPKGRTTPESEPTATTSKPPRPLPLPAQPSSPSGADAAALQPTIATRGRAQRTAQTRVLLAAALGGAAVAALIAAVAWVLSH